MTDVFLDVKHVITLRRYETHTVHAALQHFQSSDCEWLMPHTEGALKQTRVSGTDSLKRRELLEEFMFWYFEAFVIPLIKVCPRRLTPHEDFLSLGTSRQTFTLPSLLRSEIGCYIFATTTGIPSVSLSWRNLARTLSGR